MRDERILDIAAGDVRLGSVKRCAASVGEGSMAIAFVHQYLICDVFIEDFESARRITQSLSPARLRGRQSADWGTSVSAGSRVQL